MPNWCVTNYVVEGRKEELDDLYQKMKGLQEMEQPLVENGFGQTWLGCLVQSLGADPEDVGCRGNWEELERCDDTLRFDFWSAWSPSYDVIELLREKYPSLRFYYRAIEPGNQLFQKNDTNGKYFPENIWAAMDGDDYFAADKEEMLKMMKEKFDLPEHLSSLEEVKSYIDESEDHDFFCFAEFALTNDEQDNFTAQLIKGIRNGDIKIKIEESERE